MSDTTTRTELTATATTSWMRLARATALTMVAWAVLTTVVARVAIPPVLVIALIFLIFVPFLTGERRLGLGYAIVAGLTLAGNLPPIVDELTHPDSLPAFVLTLLSFTAALVAISAGLGAFFRWSPTVIRSLAISWAAVFVVGAAGSVVLSATTATDVALANDVPIAAEKVTFVPEGIELDSGTAGVWFDNKDGIRHTFTIDELGVDLEVPALKARRVEFQATPGTYMYRCTVPGHEGMIGTLVVGN